MASLTVATLKVISDWNLITPRAPVLHRKWRDYKAPIPTSPCTIPHLQFGSRVWLILGHWAQRPHTMRDCARLSLEIGFLVTSKVSRTNLQTCGVGGQSNFGGPYNKLATGQLERHLLSLVEPRDLQYELCRALDPLWHVILWGSPGSSTKCNILNFCQACALLTWMIPVTWGT